MFGDSSSLQATVAVKNVHKEMVPVFYQPTYQFQQTLFIFSLGKPTLENHISLLELCIVLRQKRMRSFEVFYQQWSPGIQAQKPYESLKSSPQDG